MFKLRLRSVCFTLLFTSIAFMFPAYINAISVVSGRLNTTSQYTATGWYTVHIIRDYQFDSQDHAIMDAEVWLSKEAKTNILGRVEGESSAYVKSD